MSFIFKALCVLPPLVLSVMIHEIAHGYIAGKFGDPTAKQSGRISLNPIKHIDPVMTILLPGFLILIGSHFVFGGAKPVPVNPMYFKNPRRDMAWVALAAIFLGFFEIFRDIFLQEDPALAVIVCGSWIVYGFIINIILGTFNLIPVPPLDGGRIAVGVLPITLAKKLASLERFGLVIIILLLASGWLEKILEPVISFFSNYLN